MNVYEFAIRLQDLATGPLMRISQKYSSTLSQISRFSNQFGQKFNSMTRRAGQSVEELRRKLSGLTEKREVAVGTTMIKSAISLMDVLLTKKKQLENNSSNGSSEKQAGFFGGLAGAARGALPALGIAGLLAGAGSFATMGMDREQTNISFEQFVGKQGVAPLMGKLNRFADVTPYTNEDVYGAGRSLLNAKVGEAQLNDKMTNIGNMASVSQKDFGGLSSAYAKVKQKGFIDYGELHEEFGGTALMDQLQKQMGVNGAQLKKMAEEGKISFDMFDRAIADLSGKGGLYEGGLEKQSQTAKGKMSTFFGTLQNKVTELATKLNPLLARIFDFGSEALTKIDPLLEKLAPVFDTLVSGVGKVWDAMAPLGTLFGELATFAGNLWEKIVGLTGGTSGLKFAFDLLAATVSVASTLLQWAGELLIWLVEGPLGTLVIAIAGITAAWWAFNAVVALNPFTFWITVLAAVVVGIKYAWDNIDGFRQTIIKCWETLKSMFNAVGPILKALVLPTPENIAAAYSAVKASFAEGLASGDRAVQVDNLKRMSANMPKSTSVGKQPAKFGEGAGSKSDKGKVKDAGLSSNLDATTGGAKATTITINLKSLVEKLTIQAGTVKEGVSDMEAQVTDALLRVLNSANSMAS